MHSNSISNWNSDAKGAGLLWTTTFVTLMEDMAAGCNSLLGAALTRGVYR